VECVGFVYRAVNTERTKRYFRESPGERHTHIHVCKAASFSEQFPLLFRDYLRTHADECPNYEMLMGGLLYVLGLALLGVGINAVRRSRATAAAVA
jgi:hypothetical protein